MTKSIRLYLSEVCAVLVMGIALLALIGWGINSRRLVSVSPDWVTMKIWTAVSFLFVGLHAILAARWDYKSSLRAFGIGYALAVFLCIFQLALLATAFAQYAHTGSNIFLLTGWNLDTSVEHSMPSLITVSVLLSYSLVCFFQKAQMLIGIFMIYLGSGCLLGYAWNLPELYGDWPHHMTPVAINTATCIVLVGISLFNRTYRQFQIK